MMLKTGLVALMGLVALTEASAIQRPDLVARASKGKGGSSSSSSSSNNNNNAQSSGSSSSGNSASETCLSSNALQTGSASTGQSSSVAADGQVDSATDNANFINFCSGKTLTNGIQNTAGSCNGIPMGDIPAKGKMVSTVILNPKNGDNIPANTDFNIQVNIANMNLGSFTNATSTYYTAPQQVASNGNIVGHTHVTVQDTGNSLNPTTPLDATQFAFFKGINDAGNGQGLLNTTVSGGLPAGNYRLCTMGSASNHQPLLMPVAQRGAQDDCKYFTVGGSGSSSGSSGSGSSSSGSGSSGSSSGSSGSTDTSSAASAATSSASSGGSGKGNQAGQGNGAAASSTATDGNQASKATSAASAATAAASAAAGGAAGAAGGSSSSSAIAGIAAPAVQDSGDSARPFSVNGDTFVNKSAAVQRACAIQNNACADAVNAGKVQGKTVSDCNAQEQQCLAASS